MMGRPKEMMISVDAVSGEVMVAFPEHPLFFRDVSELAALLDTIHSTLPRLRAARAAAIGMVEPEQDSESPDWELTTWAVSVEQMDQALDPEEVAERISAATGWSMIKSLHAFQSGFPILLGSQLSIIDALRLQQAAEFNGLAARMFGPSPR